MPPETSNRTVIAAGLLVMPHYLVEADQEGISRPVAALCPNLISFKDGIGDPRR